MQCFSKLLDIWWLQEFGILRAALRHAVDLLAAQGVAACRGVVRPVHAAGARRVVRRGVRAAHVFGRQPPRRMGLGRFVGVILREAPLLKLKFFASGALRRMGEVVCKALLIERELFRRGRLRLWRGRLRRRTGRGCGRGGRVLLRRGDVGLDHARHAQVLLEAFFVLFEFCASCSVICQMALLLFSGLGLVRPVGRV